MKLRWLEPLAGTLGVTLVRLLARTWRYRVEGAEHYDGLRADHRPFIFALWHSRILPLLALHRRQDIVLLISRHRDGEYLATLGERWGYRFVRGSSKRGGEVGLLGIVRSLREGNVVAITPDGPQGPPEKVKPGVVAAAQHADAVILPISARASRAWYLRSWDRFCIPKPFARIDVRYAPPIVVAAGKDGLREGATTLEQRLREVSRVA
ncbi:MAG TPA: lysophospholipid acyltransferase family protein [Gemmatimonadales bacterium]|nr:lysophospholipid acyltransferase family protein [Gemmatimonadales bacterium]